MTIDPTGAPSPGLHLPGLADPSPVETAGEVRYSVLSPRAMWIAAALILLVGVGVAVWLLVAYGRDGNELEAIKTAGTIVVGTGGAAALLLAARRQRSVEIALKQKDRDQADIARAHALQERIAAETRAHQERLAADTKEDAVERRVTELYTKAADQLGSDKAPVRLAGFYALERLAQNNPSQRQTIVNVLCAYLRMPYQLPGAPLEADTEEQAATRYWERLQERQVRLTAQQLLANHLRPGRDWTHPVDPFWAKIDLDLTDAHLIDFTLYKCRIRDATFSSAIVTGVVTFDSATFTGDADFSSATVTGIALFNSATFTRNAKFNAATFFGSAHFNSATFTRVASFRSATFKNVVTFDSATFASSTDFDSASFAWDMPDGLARFRPHTKTENTSGTSG